MPSLSLNIDVQNRQLVRGFSNSIGAQLPNVFLGDTLPLTMRFMSPTTDPSNPYVDVDYSSAFVEVGVGAVGGVPTGGTFKLSDTASSQNTAAIPYNSTAAAVQSAINSALTTNWSTATVSGPTGGPWIITNGANGAQPLLAGNSSLLTPLSSVQVLELIAGTSTNPEVQQINLIRQVLAYANTWSAGPAAGSAITSLQSGGPATSNVQQIALTNTPNSGTFKITSPSDSLTSSAIAYNAQAAAVQAALGSGFTVSEGVGGPWIITRNTTGTATALTCNISALTGVTAATVTVLTAGATGVAMVCLLTFTGTPTAGYFTITSPTDSYTTPNINWNANSSTVLAALTSTGLTWTVAQAPGTNYIVTRVAVGAALALTVDTTSLTTATGVPGYSQSTITAGGLGTQNIQQVALTNSPSGGTWVLTTDSGSSSAIPYNATAAQLQAILGSNYIVSGNTGGPWVITHVATGTVAAYTVNASGLQSPITLTGNIPLTTTTLYEVMGDLASIAETLEISVTPTGGYKATVVQAPITIENNLIKGTPTTPPGPSSFLTQSQADARYLPQADALSVSATGSSTLARLSPTTTHQVIASAGSGAYTYTATLGNTSARAGDLAIVVINEPTTNATIVIQDQASTSTLATVAPTGSAYTSTCVFLFGGTNWSLVYKSA